jgi:predicted nucleic acid-binding protein
VAKLLVDTDVLVAHLRGERRFDPAGAEIYVSTITRVELLSSRVSDNSPLRQLLAATKEIPLDEAVAERAGSIRKATRRSPRRRADRSQCDRARLMLVTTNIWAFRGIDGLDATSP